MTLIARVLLIVEASITALFVSRDALNFGVITTLIAVILIALLLLLAAFWRLRPAGRAAQIEQVSVAQTSIPNRALN